MWKQHKIRISNLVESLEQEIDCLFNLISEKTPYEVMMDNEIDISQIIHSIKEEIKDV